MKFYRVKHPAAPDLYVWWVERYPRYESDILGQFDRITIHFAQVRGPMTKEDAEEMAAEIGGTVEEVELP